MHASDGWMESLGPSRDASHRNHHHHSSPFSTPFNPKNSLKTCQATCPDEFGSYVECLEYHSNKFEKCRKEQAAFEEKLPATK